MASAALCSPVSRPDEARRWGRASASVVASLALIFACCYAVLTAREGSGTRSELDERSALRLAEGKTNNLYRDRVAYGGTRAEQKLSEYHRAQRLLAVKAQVLAARSTPLASQGPADESNQALATEDVKQAAAHVQPTPTVSAADARHAALKMAESYFPPAPRKWTRATLNAQGEAVEPIWPGLADFEKHEAALRIGDTKMQKLEWNPNCPCRGGCPCPAHGHGSNIVNPALPKVRESAELKRGLEEGMALGLKIGFKAGIAEGSLQEMASQQHPPASAGETGGQLSAGVKAIGDKIPLCDENHPENCKGARTPAKVHDVSVSGAKATEKAHTPTVAPVAGIQAARSQPASHSASAAAPDRERRFVESVEHKYEEAVHAMKTLQAREMRLQDSKAAATAQPLAAHEAEASAPVQRQVLTGKAEDKYIKDIEERLRTEKRVYPQADDVAKGRDDVGEHRSAPKQGSLGARQVVSEADAMARVLSDLNSLRNINSSGKTSQPSSSANLPWPFKRSHETPYPEPTDGEYRGAPIPSSPKSSAKAPKKSSNGRRTAVGITASEAQHALDSLAAQQASHEADVDVITHGGPWGYDSKAKAEQHLTAKAAAFARKARAQASHDADVTAIAAPFSTAAAAAHDTSDFDERAARMKMAIEHPKAQNRHAAHPWLAKAIQNVHDESFKIPRSLQQRADDKLWQDQSAEAERQMQAAKHELALVSGAASSAVSQVQVGDKTGRGAEHLSEAARALGFSGLSAFDAHVAGVEERQKEVAKEVGKDGEVAQKVRRLIQEHKLVESGKAAETELAALHPSVLAAPMLQVRAPDGFSEADAHALGFDGLSGLEQHLARSGTRTAVRKDSITLCDEHHPENCKGIRADKRGHVHEASAVGGSPHSIKGRLDEEDAVMREAIRKAAVRKALAAGKPAAEALGFSGVQQLATHLEREALDLE